MDINQFNLSLQVIDIFTSEIDPPEVEIQSTESYQIPNIYNHETDDSKSNNEFEELENELLRKTRNRVNKNHDQFRKNKSRTEGRAKFDKGNIQ